MAGLKITVVPPRCEVCFVLGTPAHTQEQARIIATPKLQEDNGPQNQDAHSCILAHSVSQTLLCPKYFCVPNTSVSQVLLPVSLHILCPKCSCVTGTSTCILAHSVSKILLCHRYFYLPARGEHRGIGGLFFDDMEKGMDASKNFDAEAFTRDVGQGIVESWRPIVGGCQGGCWHPE